MDHSEDHDCAVRECTRKGDIRAMYVPNPHIKTDPKAAPFLFTGHVRCQDGTYVKLDDPRQDIDIGEPVGHVMDDAERATELIQLTLGDDDDEAVDPKNFALGPIRQETDMFEDFADHPDRQSLPIVPDEVERTIDQKYPFPGPLQNRHRSPFDPWTAKDVRFLDGVLLMAKNKGDKSSTGAPVCFWATVLSVTSTGIVTAESKATLPPTTAGGAHEGPIQDEELLAFPITRVYGVRKGPHWKKDTSKKSTRQKIRARRG